jgi:hypothetical protein
MPLEGRQVPIEVIGHRSIYHDGWRAVRPWPGPSLAEARKPFGTPLPAEALTELDATGWEPYHVASDSPRTTIPDGAGWTVVPWWYVLAVPAIPIALIASVIGWLVASTLQHRATRHQSGPAPASSCIPPR